MREFIQSKLEEIKGLEVTPEIPDDLIEDGKTYFSFSLQNDFQNSDLDKNYTYRPSFIGFVKRRKNTTENTLEIVDNMTIQIVNKFKELNFKTSYNDVTVDSIQKNRVTGNSLYNEITERLGG